MAQLSTTTRDILDKASLPEFQAAGLGTTIYEASKYAPVVIRYVVSTTHVAAKPAFVAPFAMRIVDVIVQAQAAATTGALQPLKAAAEMCTTIACVTDGVVSHMAAGATAATAANRLLAAGDVVNVIATGSDATEAAKVAAVVTFIGERV